MKPMFIPKRKIGVRPKAQYRLRRSPMSRLILGVSLDSGVIIFLLRIAHPRVMNLTDEYPESRIQL